LAFLPIAEITIKIKCARRIAANILESFTLKMGIIVLT